MSYQTCKCEIHEYRVTLCPVNLVARDSGLGTRICDAGTISRCGTDSTGGKAHMDLEMSL